MLQNVLELYGEAKTPKYVANIEVNIYSKGASNGIKSALGDVLNEIGQKPPVVTGNGFLVMQNMQLSNYAANVGGITVYKTSYNDESDSCDKNNLEPFTTINDLSSSNIVLGNINSLGIDTQKRYCLYFVSNKEIILPNGKVERVQTKVDDNYSIQNVSFNSHSEIVP